MHVRSSRILYILITIIFIFNVCPFLIFHQSLPVTLKKFAPVLRSPWWHDGTCPPISIVWFMSCFRSLPSLPLLYSSIDLCLSRSFYDKWAFYLIMPTWSLFTGVTISAYHFVPHPVYTVPTTQFVSFNTIFLVKQGHNICHIYTTVTYSHFLCIKCHRVQEYEQFITLKGTNWGSPWYSDTIMEIPFYLTHVL